MKFDRRKFLSGLGLLTGGLILEQIPFNRVWSFPSKIVIPKLKRGNWVIQDDWSESDQSYSVLYDTSMMPEVAHGEPTPLIEGLTTNGYAIIVHPELRQIARQILNGAYIQRDRITLDKLKYSNFKYSSV